MSWVSTPDVEGRILAIWADLERRTVRGLSATEQEAAIALLTRLARNVATED